MRKILCLLILSGLFVSTICAQINQNIIKSKLDSIIKLDSAIHNIKQFNPKSIPSDADYGSIVKLLNNLDIDKSEFTIFEDSVFTSADRKVFIHEWESVKNKKLNLEVPILSRLVDIENPSISPDTLIYLLEKVREFEAIYELYTKLNNRIVQLEKNGYETVYLGGLKRNLKIIENHMNYLLESNYCQYRYINTSNQKIKGVYIAIDNDFFGLNNWDRNYTGGGRIEVTTDFLKMRLLTFLNNDKILAYQGVFFGTEAYTPKIRDTSIFKIDTSFDINDRPFASYQYIGRSKYRMHYNGHARVRSDFKLGIIGGNVGNAFQSVIHRDQFVSSVKPYGWDSQIANGGRFAWNIDHYIDVMLYSGQGDVLNSKRNNHKTRWINIPVLAELHLGNELTAVGVGLGFSTLSFKQRSGNEDIILYSHRKVNCVASANFRYRYVIHNSMLEGLGMFNTFKDDDDPFAPKDIYRLESNEVERNLIWGEVFLGICVMKATFYYKYTFNTKEYHKEKARNYYSWGRIGINFLL